MGFPALASWGVGAKRASEGSLFLLMADPQTSFLFLASGSVPSHRPALLAPLDSVP